MSFLGVAVYATSTDLISSYDVSSRAATFLCCLLFVCISFLCLDRMVDLASDSLRYLPLKFLLVCMFAFVSINQETHWAFLLCVLSY